MTYDKHAINGCAKATAQAHLEGFAQMALCFDAAQRRDETFGSRAYVFLCAFARNRYGPFSGEDVTDAAAEAGIHTAERRAWGAIFQRAARARVIRRSSALFRRRFGHGSPTLGWERCA